MEMVKEFTRAEALAAQLYNVVRWLDQDVAVEIDPDYAQLFERHRRAQRCRYSLPALVTMADRR